MWCLAEKKIKKTKSIYDHFFLKLSVDWGTNYISFKVNFENSKYVSLVFLQTCLSSSWFCYNFLFVLNILSLGQKKIVLFLEFNLVNFFCYFLACIFEFVSKQIYLLFQTLPPPLPPLPTHTQKKKTKETKEEIRKTKETNEGPILDTTLQL